MLSRVQLVYIISNEGIQINETYSVRTIPICDILIETHNSEPPPAYTASSLAHSSVNSRIVHFTYTSSTRMYSFSAVTTLPPFRRNFIKTLYVYYSLVHQDQYHILQK
jgi:hypothetical protein